MKRIVHALLAVFASHFIAISQPVITFQTLVSGLSSPVDVANAKDGSNRLFIVEKPGTIRIWTGTALRSDTFLNITSIVQSAGSEQGLLSVAFHPNYATNGYFYVWYNNKQGNVTLARYTRSSTNAADQSSGVILMTVYKPYTNHNGADLNFGPDGFLYFGTGDGGSGGDPGNRAQNGDSLQGKMMRIDVNNPNPPYYSIPPTNPYINNANIRDEIIAIGLRNPWRWSFDRQTGDMWIADVGQDAWEEVNFRNAASILNCNYRWSCSEGNHEYKASCGYQATIPAVDPIFEYPHNSTTGGFSITGGFVYRGTEFPALQGYYIASDYVSNHGWLIKSNGSVGWNTTMQSTWANSVSSYGEGEDGSLYATSLTGSLLKVVVSSTVAIHLNNFYGRQADNYDELNWEVQNEESGDVYTLEKRMSTSGPFTEMRTVPATASKTSNKYSVRIPSTSASSYYRLLIKSRDGRIQYSAIVLLEANNTLQHVKGIVSGKTLHLSLPTGAKTITLFDAAGRKMLEKEIADNNNEDIPLTNISRGMLTVRVQLQKAVETLRILY